MHFQNVASKLISTLALPVIKAPDGTVLAIRLNLITLPLLMTPSKVLFTKVMAPIETGPNFIFSSFRIFKVIPG